jgi:hypothetical protein
MSPNFTGAIKELRAIKDDLSLSHPEQSINILGSKNPITTAHNILFSLSVTLGFASLTP